MYGYGNLKKARDRAHAYAADLHKEKRLKVKAMLEEIGATTPEQINAVAPEVIAHIMATVGYTEENLAANAAANEEVRERDAEFTVKSVNAHGLQDPHAVSALSTGFQEHIRTEAAKRSAGDGTDPSFAVVIEEQRVLDQLGSTEKPRSLGALLEGKDTWQAQPVFDAALEQPAPEPQPDSPPTWSTEKLDAALNEYSRQEAEKDAAAADTDALPSVAAMRRDLERWDAEDKAKAEANTENSFKRFFPDPS